MKEHWQTVYANKKLTEVSWYQPEPITAIEYLKELKISKDASIIDVGGGDGFFVDYLLEHNYSNITVLDISENAIRRAKERLGEKANTVNWIVSDITEFKSKQAFDFWYDRAVFHFLTSDQDIDSYVDNLSNCLSNSGKVTIGTFSERGPRKCSGLDIRQYTAQQLEEVLSKHFNCHSCRKIDHPTPFDTIQNFTFCSFVKK
jgi:cyclopropane fatty-acyl-phospholipid synthase-like methyltransferase